MRPIPLPLAAVCLLAAGGCADAPRPRDALLELQRVERRAHLDYDADALAALAADTVVLVEGGGATRLSREAFRERFARYLDEVVFLEWSDLDPPVVRLAASGDMATVRVRRRVRLGTTDSAGRSRLEHTVFAWTETWVREGGGWGIVQVTSTERAGERDVAAAERRADVAAPATERILARARAAVEDLPGASVDSVRTVSFVSEGSSADGPFRTVVRSRRDGAIFLAQRTSGGQVVRREIGALEDASPGDARPRGAGPPPGAGGGSPPPGASGANRGGGERAAPAGTRGRAEARHGDDAVGAGRAFLQGHAVLHLALDPAAVLGPPVGAGTMTFAGVPADVVVFRDGAGHPLELAHDRGTGRLLGGRIRNPADTGDVILLYLSGWQAVDGLLLPRRAAYLQGGDLYLHRLEEVRLNPPEDGGSAGIPGRRAGEPREGDAPRP